MARASEADETNEDWRTLVQAIQMENTKEIIQKVRIQSNFWRYPLRIAVLDNKTKAIETLLQCKVDPNKSIGPTHNTPLHFAILNRNLSAIKTLIEHGADLEKFNIFLYTPFLTAMENGSDEVISFFIENAKFWKHSLGLNLWVESYNQCPIFSLLLNRNPQAWRHLDSLLGIGVDTNVANVRGNTPILETLYTKEAATAACVIKSLAAHGAWTNYTNGEGITPLFKGVSLDEPQVLRALLEVESLDINQPNMFNLTPLFYAVSNSRNTEVFQILMKAGSDPTISAAFTMRGKIVDQATALLQALVMERIEILKLFFDYGFTMKRSWFKNGQPTSMAWEKAKQLSNKTPSLKSLARKAIKQSLACYARIPKMESLASLELPSTLTNYIAFN